MFKPFISKEFILKHTFQESPPTRQIHHYHPRTHAFIRQTSKFIHFTLPILPNSHSKLPNTNSYQSNTNWPEIKLKMYRIFASAYKFLVNDNITIVNTLLLKVLLLG